MLNASTVDREYHTASTVLVKQSRRQDHLREILSNQFVQPAGHKVSLCEDCSITRLVSPSSDGASAVTINRITHGVYCLTALLIVVLFTEAHS